MENIAESAELVRLRSAFATSPAYWSVLPASYLIGPVGPNRAAADTNPFDQNSGMGTPKPEALRAGSNNIMAINYVYKPVRADTTSRGGRLVLGAYRRKLIVFRYALERGKVMSIRVRECELWQVTYRVPLLFLDWWLITIIKRANLAKSIIIHRERWIRFQRRFSNAADRSESVESIETVWTALNSETFAIFPHTKSSIICSEIYGSQNGGPVSVSVTAGQKFL